MSVNQPLFPGYGSGVTVTPGASSASTTVAAGTKQIIATCSGAEVVYVRITPSDSTAAASSADYPILPGTQTVISRDQTFSRVAYIGAAGTSSLHLMSCEGY